MNSELLNKAMKAKSPEELLKIVREGGMEDFTEESAKAYFDLASHKGELSDDELSNAAGGCKKDGKRVVTVGAGCVGFSNTMNLHLWKCDKCGEDDTVCPCYGDPGGTPPGVFRFGLKNQCGNCGWCHYVKGLWLCYNPKANEM